MRAPRSIHRALILALLVIVFRGSPGLGADDPNGLRRASPNRVTDPGASVSIAFDRTRVHLDGAGNRDMVRETLCTMLRDSATGEWASPTLRFDARRDTLIVESARWKAPDGEWNDLGASDLSVFTIPEARWASAYARLQDVGIAFPPLRSGSAVYFRYRIESKTTQGRRTVPDYGDVILFGGRESIGEMSYEIHAGAGRDIHYEMQNAAFDPEIISSDSGTLYRWQQTDLPPIPRESNTADLALIVPRLCWTTYPDWEAFGLEVSERFWAGVEASQQAVDEWSQITSPELWGIPGVMNVANFVSQRIRSVNVAPSEIGFEPLTADRVWGNLYANALDKAVLLAGLIRAYGYEAIPVLVPGWPGPFSTLPVLQQFHHVIISVPTGEDTLWFDPMARFSPPGELPASDSYGMGCLLVGGAPLLLTVPLTVPEVRTEIRTSLSENGDLEGTQTYLPQGYVAAQVRADLAPLTADELQRFAQSSLSRWDGAARLTDLRVSNTADLLEPVAIELRFERQNAAARKRKRMSMAVPSASFDSVRARLSALSSETCFPIMLPPPCRVTRTLSLTIPAGWRFFELPPMLLIDNPFLRIEITARMSETVLHWTEIIEIKRDIVPVADFPTVRESVQTSFQPQYQQIILERE
ncbi:MAG: DUF3857 domain-containing protein [bacterium]|nr:DUF3857 domain-containing protein [bacterium]